MLVTAPKLYICQIDLTTNWIHWRESEPVVLSKPEMEYEGSDLYLQREESLMEKVQQMRDPAIFLKKDQIVTCYTQLRENRAAVLDS